MYGAAADVWAEVGEGKHSARSGSRVVSTPDQPGRAERECEDGTDPHGEDLGRRPKVAFLGGSTLPPYCARSCILTQVGGQRLAFHLVKVAGPLKARTPPQIIGKFFLPRESNQAG